MERGNEVGLEKKREMCLGIVWTFFEMVGRGWDRVLDFSVFHQKYSSFLCLQQQLQSLCGCSLCWRVGHPSVLYSICAWRICLSVCPHQQAGHPCHPAHQYSSLLCWQHAAVHCGRDQAGEHWLRGQVCKYKKIFKFGMKINIINKLYQCKDTNPEVRRKII